MSAHENDFGIVDSSDEEVYIGPATEKEKSRITHIASNVESHMDSSVTNGLSKKKCDSKVMPEAVAAAELEEDLPEVPASLLPEAGKSPAAKMSELDDTLTRMEKLLAMSENDDANSDVHSLFMKVNPFQRTGDAVTSPSTVYATPRDSVDSKASYVTCDINSPKQDFGLPYCIKEEPELEVSTGDLKSPQSKGRKTSTPIQRRESVESLKATNLVKKEKTPLRERTPLRPTGNMPSPGDDRFATPLSSPAVKGVAKGTPVAKTAPRSVSKPVSETPQNFKTPPRTPRSGTFVKTSSSSKHSRARTPSSLTKKVAQKLFSETRIPKPTTNPRLANIVSPIGRYINERPVPNFVRRIKPPSFSVTNSSHERLHKSLNSSLGNAAVSSVGKENSDPKSLSVISSSVRSMGYALPPVHRTKPDETKLQDASRPQQALPRGKIGRLMAPNLKYQVEKHAGRVKMGNAEVSILLAKPAEINK